jgi:hypothetical protein
MKKPTLKRKRQALLRLPTSIFYSKNKIGLHCIAKIVLAPTPLLAMDTKTIK